MAGTAYPSCQRSTDHSLASGPRRHTLVSVDDHTISVLEFDKVLDLLEKQCAFSVSREMAAKVRPATSFEHVAALQTETAEMTELEHLGIEIPTVGCSDIRDHLKAAAKGRALEVEDLVAVAQTLRTALRARQVVERLYERLPALMRIAEAIEDFRPAAARVDEAINTRGEIDDNASPQLASVRRELRQAQERVEQRAQSALADAVRRGIAQDGLLTERSGRTVIPIKADFRGHMPGIVHDVSASGATIFLEPMSVVDAGNESRELELAERREVRRILEELSAMFGERHEDAANTLAGIAHLDLVRAKVRLGRTYKAKLPFPADGTSWINDAGETNLARGRHPLLRGEVVPLNVDIGDEFPGLVITGPNTGGKTVALKTFGLLTLMVQAGLPVPCDEESRFAVYSQIEADIGDEQSIEQSLSTFSSHMRNVRRILAHAAPGTLVLLDELGAGTDPTEGTALSRSILQALLNRGCRIMATTHHSELKTFAHENPRMRNASVDFDLETLSPTYHLTVGLPGQSNAIAIARRLGIDEAVLQDAESALEPSHAEFEQLLNEIRTEREGAREARHDEEEARKQSQSLQIELARDREGIDEERAEILRDARREAEDLVAEARRELNRLQRRGRSVDTSAADQRLLELDEKVVRSTKSLPRAQFPVLEEVEDIEPGDTLHVRDIPQPGEALSGIGEDGRVEAQFGALRMKVAIDRIASVDHKTEKQHITIPEQPKVAQELDIRGQRAQDALEICDAYLDDAFRDGHPYVRIIHGRGTGALRLAIREELSRHPLVRKYETAPPNEGGDGVTVAILAG
jgi:DNA mismatch repair protein MutS2